MFDIERFRLTPFEKWKWDERERQQLARMSHEEREAYYEAQEADAMRDALSDESWGSA
jgi:hypothetical protein